jgi:hypothetical protein
VSVCVCVCVCDLLHFNVKSLQWGRNKRTEDHLFPKRFRTWVINNSKEVVSS